MCPANALKKRRLSSRADRIKKTCSSHSADLNKQFISPCGICIKVCPVGNDRKQYNRTDPGIYENKDHFANYEKAWNHVRSYGRKNLLRACLKIILPSSILDFIYSFNHYSYHSCIY